MRFRRDQDRFAYLQLGGAQAMLEERRKSSWETAALQRPFGRGINLQIEVDDVEYLHTRITGAGIPFFRDLLRTEYRENDTVHVAYEFPCETPTATCCASSRTRTPSDSSSRNDATAAERL